MVDVTDPAFRSIAKEWGADVTCSEMVASAGLVNDNARSWELTKPFAGESPYGVQIMGGDAEQMARAVQLVEERVGPDYIDVNLGCPSPNILRSCAGGFLLRDPALASNVITAAVEAANNTPVSVKLRTGPSIDRDTYIEVGRAAQDAGAAWCTLHGRSVDQGYSGSADWTKIGLLVTALDIPVIGNGDLRNGDDVLRMKEQTECHGFFIARAAMNDPTVFSRMKAQLQGTEAPEPTVQQRLQMLATYWERNPAANLAHLKRQASRFLQGQPGAKRLRTLVHDCDGPQLRELIRNHDVSQSLGRP